MASIPNELLGALRSTYLIRCRKTVTLQTISRIALAIGMVSMLTVVLAILALQDIYHGEADLTLEWTMLRVSSIVIIVFHVVALIVVWKAFRSAAGREPR